MSNSKSEWKTENGAESGAEEDTCLDKNGAGGGAPTRLGAMRERLVGNTQLSPAIRLALYVLVGLCLVLLIVVIVMAVCWPRLPYEGYRCNTAACLGLSSTYVQWMGGDGNEDASLACTDPQRWACAGWIGENSHRIPARSSWSLAEELRVQELRRLRDLLSTMARQKSQDSPYSKLKMLYDSCMALDIIEGEGVSPKLLTFINQLGGWHVTRDWSRNSWSWREALEALQTKYGVTPLFSASVTWGSGNNTFLHLRPSGLGLPDPSFYFAGPDTKPVKAYKALLKDAALSLDAATLDASVFADDIFAFEQRLAKSMSEELNDVKQQVMTVKELNDNPQFLPFVDILRALFPKVPLLDNTEILVTAPFYISHLSVITTGTDLSILNDYFTWNLIREYLPYMSRSFRLIWKEYQFQMTGSTEELPRWEFCAQLVQQTAPLACTSLLEAEAYTELVKNNGTDAAVENMFETIKTAALDEITRSNTVDGHTKSLMLEQVNNLKFQIGLKPHEKTEEYLKEYYRTWLLQKHNLFQNVQNGLEFEQHLVQQAYLNKDINVVRDNSRFLILPQASYNTHTRTVMLPSALLYPPFFSTEYPRSVQYARLGVMIGTAVAKALAVIDPDEDFSIPKYAHATVYCLNDMLTNTPHSEKGQSAVVASTAYLRLIGAQLALAGAHSAPDDHPLIPQLEQYSGDSLFALAYAQSLCSMHTPEQAVLDGINLQIDGDTMFRVTWTQLEALQESLSCKQEKKCADPL